MLTHINRRDVLDEIWDVIESVSEGFLTYSFILCALNTVDQQWHKCAKGFAIAGTSWTDECVH